MRRLPTNRSFRYKVVIGGQLVQSGIPTSRFRIDGMCCAEETTLLRSEVADLLRDPESLRFDLLKGHLLVDEEMPDSTKQELLSRVAKTGMKGVLLEDGARDSAVEDPARSGSSRLRISTVLAAFSTLCALAVTLLPESWIARDAADAVSLVLYGIAAVTGLVTVFPRAISAIRLRRPDMNLLMSIAVIGAFVIDEPFEGAVIATLFAFSLLLESWSIGRARRAVEKLMERAPARATRIDSDGSGTPVDPADIIVGDTLLVRPGELFPVDGRVADGTGDVDAAAVTGESRPVTVSFGSPVYAGTMSLDAPLKVVATRVASDSTWAKIVRLVDEAGTRRSESERWVERFARLYTPIVFGVAILVALLPTLFGLGEWSTWVYRGLVILVIGCPCALVIATPVAVVSGLAAAARVGVLIKGGEYLERPASLTTVALDKTGTLTTGELAVSKISAVSGSTEREVLAVARALEEGSNHPVARAVVAAAVQRDIGALSATEVRQLPGRGMIGRHDGQPLLVGSLRLLDDHGIPVLGREDFERDGSGRSLVAVARDGAMIGHLFLGDEIRAEARAAISDLQTLGVSPVLLSGDGQAAADGVASSLGITEVVANVLPEQKMEAISALTARGGTTAMVGDGINDAPAMAAADFGIAMGIRGTDVALESADVVLMHDDLRRLPWLVRHARRAIAVIRTNIYLALGIKLAVFIGTFLGLATLWAAILADIGATLLVSANALRLLRSR